MSVIESKACPCGAQTRGICHRCGRSICTTHHVLKPIALTSKEGKTRMQLAAFCAPDCDSMWWGVLAVQKAVES